METESTNARSPTDPADSPLIAAAEYHGLRFGEARDVYAALIAMTPTTPVVITLVIVNIIVFCLRTLDTSATTPTLIVC